MLAYLFVVLAGVLRFISLPISFAPVGPALLFFGAYGLLKRAWIPVVLLAGCDLALTKFVYEYAYTLDHLVMIAWYAAVLALGVLLRDNTRLARVATAAVVASVAFFIVSNFAVWLVWNMYPHNVGGLFACYIAAVPFFRNQFVSDVLSAVLMFGVPALFPRFRRAPARV